MPSTTAATTADDALARYVAHGDEDAFRALLAAYNRLVRSVCGRVLDEPAAVDDAVQETFIRLARGAHAIRGNVGSWLYSTAMNTSLSLRRSMLARRRHERACAREDDAVEPEAPAEHEFLLEQCLAELAPEDRKVIVAYYNGGRSQRRIAEEWGMSQPAVKKRLDRALRALRWKLLARGIGSEALAGGHDRAGAFACCPGDGSAALVVAALALARPSPLTTAARGLLRWSWLCATLLWLTRWRLGDDPPRAAIA